MAVAIGLRGDYAAARLRQVARSSRRGDQVRRLLALAAIYEGASRTQTAAIGQVTLQIVRDWVLRFNAHGPDGRLDRKPPGKPRRLSDAHRAALAELVERGPIPAVDGVVRWRVIDLRQRLREMFELSVSRQTLQRELRSVNYRKLSARPRHHAQAAGAIEDFKKLPFVLAEIVRRQGVGADDIEIWFGDQARIGQKNKITRRWAKRGSRPSAPHAQRTASTYIFGAICPKDGKAVALVLPRCKTAAMNLHLAAIAADVGPGMHAVLLLDQAGWHLSKTLIVPDCITIVPLPAKCPEPWSASRPKPQEKVSQFMRNNWLSNRVFDDHDTLTTHCCEAWMKLEA